MTPSRFTSNFPKILYFFEVSGYKTPAVPTAEENADRSLHLDLALSLRCLAKFFWHYPVVAWWSIGFPVEKGLFVLMRLD
jgi:hypothetical protein